MRSILYFWFLGTILTSLVTATVAADSAPHSSVPREADVVRAVGVVRYFYPHDAVTEVDWNRVLLEGFRLADQHSESSDAAFARSLAELLGQVGDGISHRSDADGSPLPSAPECPAEATPVRWVHEGFGADPSPENRPPYRSWRSGVSRPPEGTAFSTAIKDLPAKDWRGQALSFSSEVRLPEGGEAALWVGIRDAEDTLLHFDNMDRQRIDDIEWAAHSLHFEVPENAERLAIGLMVHGAALAEFRRIRLRRVDETSEEAGSESLLPDPDQWQGNSAGIGHELQIDTNDQDILVRLAPHKTKTEPPGPLPTALVNAPATATVSLMDGSLLQVPMVLCPQQAALSASDRERLAADFPALDVESLPPPDKARLDVSVLWTVMQHFYPYREKMHGWSDALYTALGESRSVEHANDHRRLLQRLTFHLEDGHVLVRPAARDASVESAWLPIAVESVDGELFVSRSDEQNVARPGDRIAAIDGEPAAQWLERELVHRSGSRPWRTHLAIVEL
ncbi:MAG: hypothetical protein ACNA7E_10455, partial [Wenzhouxiangellaceae bacterium]